MNWILALLPLKEEGPSAVAITSNNDGNRLENNISPIMRVVHLVKIGAFGSPVCHLDENEYLN